MNDKKIVNIRYPLLNDKVFKFVFSNLLLQDALLKSIAVFIDNEKISHDIENIDAQGLLMAPFYDTKDYYGDVLTTLKNNTIVSMEAYNLFGYEEFVKSLCYVCRIFGNQLKVNEKYSKASDVVGITLFRKKTDFIMDNVMEEYKLSEQIYKLKVNNNITLYLIDLDKVAKFTYNKSEIFYEFANIMKKEWLCDMEEYIKDKEDEMLEKTVAYVREFLGDPKNQDLLNHFDSEVRNAKYEGRTEGRVEGRAEGRALEKKQTAINMFKLGITKDLIMKSTGLNDEDLHELSIN